MTHGHIHETHPAIIARLKRASGHLQSAISMIEVGRPCVELAQQLHAIEKAVAKAKRMLIHDHIDHCLVHHAHSSEGEHSHHAMDEFNAISKYL